MPEDEAAPTEAPPKTTTSGAQTLFHTNAWLTAAAVAVYTTKALWVKLREMGLRKMKSSENEADNIKDNKSPVDGSLVESSLDQNTDQLLCNGQLININGN